MESCKCRNAAYSIASAVCSVILPEPLAPPETTAMNLKLSLMLTVAMTACTLIVGAGVASAQDTYQVNYFSNNLFVNVGGGIGKPINLPDASIRIDNPGLTYANLCAMIYVFDADQQMTECCGCVETHNGLRTIPIPSLTLNPLTGVISQNGVIKIVSAAVNNSPCDPTANVTPKPNLRAWGLHIQNQLTVGGPFPVTETAFSNSALGTTELANLQAQCSFINILGSGHGICSCGTGD